MIFKDDIRYAMRAGFGSLLGFLMGIGLKLAASFIMTFYFVREWIHPPAPSYFVGENPNFIFRTDFTRAAESGYHYRLDRMKPVFSLIKHN
jgi:hypothetical protein